MYKDIKKGVIFPSKEDKIRLNRIKQNQMIFKGRYAEVFFKDFMTRLKMQDINLNNQYSSSPNNFYGEVDYNSVVVIANIAGAVTRVFSDMLFGEFPEFKAKNKEHQKWTDDFIKRNKLNEKLYALSCSQSYEGDALMKLGLSKEDGAKVITLSSSDWFPLSSIQDVHDVTKDYLCYFIELDEEECDDLDGGISIYTDSGNKVVSSDKRRKFVTTEEHTVGKIKYKAYEIINQRLTPIKWDDELFGKIPSKEILTKVNRSLVFRASNFIPVDELFGIGDYDDIITLLKELSIRLTQASRVLDKHADPNMIGPHTLMQINEFTGKEEVRAGGSYYAVDEGQVKPEYVVWDSNTKDVFEFIEIIERMLYITTDTNKIALNTDSGGRIPSGSAIKTLLFKPLLRTKRKRTYWQNILLELFETAASLERNNGFLNAPGDDYEIEILWKDGIPDDPMEKAQIANLRTGNKPTISQETAVMEFIGEEKIQEEMKKILEEEKRGIEVNKNAKVPLTASESEKEVK